MRRGVILVAILAILPSFLGYLLTLSPSVAVQGDSGELVTVAARLGVAHPPGYPLYTLLGHVFTFLPFGSVAWRVNLFSAVAHGATLFFVFLTLERVTKNRLAALGGTFVLAFSYTFWLYSLVAEVFALNDLFASILIYISVWLGEVSGKKAVVPLCWLVLFFSLGLFHQQTIVLLSVPVFYYIYPTLKSFLTSFSKRQLLKQLFVFLVLGTVGFLPYLYVFIRAKTTVVPVAWSYPADLESLLRLFARADYGSLSAYAGSDPALVTLSQKWSQVVNYLRFSWDDFTLLGTVIGAFGLLFFWKVKSRFAVFVGLGFVTALFFLTYANFPLQEFSGATLAIVERFYLLPNIFMALAIGLGLGSLFSLLSSRPVGRILSMVLTIFLVVPLFLRNYPLVDQSKNFLGINFARNVLRTLPQKALLLPQGDVPTLLTFYARYVEGYRLDVEIVTPNLPAPANSYRYLRQVRSDLDFTLPRAASISGLVEANLGKVRVFTVGPPGFSFPGFVASQSGLLFEFKKETDVASFREWKLAVESDLQKYELPSSEEIPRFLSGTLSDRVILGLYSTMFLSLGDYCEFNSDWECAVGYYKRALGFDSSLLTFLKLGRAYGKVGQCSAANNAFQSVLKMNPQASFVYSDLKTLARDCYKNSKLEKFYDAKVSETILDKGGDLKNL